MSDESIERLPIPRVAGIAGGVGTTLVATLLGVHQDCGVLQVGDNVDVLVCRCLPGQIAESIASINHQKHRPVLVVVDDSPLPWPRTSRQRVDMCGPNVPAIIRVPWIEHLRTADDPHKTLSIALHQQTYLEDLPRWVRSTQLAAEQLVSAVTSLLVHHTTEKVQS